MPLIRVKNETLIDKRESTFMTAAAAAADLSITVKDNSNFVTNNDYYVIGEIGSETAEIIQNNASTTLGTTITFDGGGGSGGGLAFAHPINTPVRRIDYNQVAFYNAQTTTAPASGSTQISGSPIAVQFDDTYTRLNDTASTAGYIFIRFYNTTTGGYSDPSAAIPFGGHTQRSLWETARRVYKHLGFQLSDDMDESEVKFSEVRRVLNDKQRDIVHDRLWTFAEGERSFATVANQFRYVPDSTRVGIINTVTSDSKPLKYIDRQVWEMTHIDSDSTSSYATHFSVWNNEIHLYPKPSTAASSTAINMTSGLPTTTSVATTAVTTTATTITVGTTTNYPSSGVISINGDLINYTGTTATTFTGVTNISQDHAIGETVTLSTITVDDSSGFRSIGGFYRFIINSEVIYATGATSTTFTGLLRGMEGTTVAAHVDNDVITERDIVYTYQVEPTDLSDITDETVVPEPEVLALGAAADLARGALRDNSLADRLDKLYKENYLRLISKYSKKVKTTFNAVKDVENTVDSRGLLDPNDYPQSLT